MECTCAKYVSRYSSVIGLHHPPVAHAEPASLMVIDRQSSLACEVSHVKRRSISWGRPEYVDERISFRMTALHE